MAALVGGAPGRFGGLDVRAQGPVWYFLSEDSHGFAARARARELAHGAAPHLHLFEEVPLLTAPIGDLLAFLRAARDQQPASPVLVVLDIFADATPGEDENAAGVMVPVMRRARLIGRLLNCAILLVHHTPKANPKDARGSSAFKGALDVMVAVTQDAKGTINLSPVKFKTSPLRRELKFHVRDNVLHAGPNTVTDWADPYTERGAAELAGRVVHELFVSKSISKAVLNDHLRAARPEWFDAEDINVVTRRRRLHDAGVAAEKAGYIMAKGAGFVPGPAEPEQLSVLPVQSPEEVTV